MIHATMQTSAKEKLYNHEQDDIAAADEEVEEIKMPQTTNAINKRFTQTVEKFASTRLGQMMLEKTDRILKVIEDTAKWSLPQDDANIQLERPLPWLLFLTLIVFLRISRIWLSMACRMMGSQPITAHTMVYYLQTRRRRLRAIRVNGLKSLGDRERETTVRSSSEKGISLLEKLGKICNRAICKTGQRDDVAARRVLVQNVNNVKDAPERASKRPRDDDVDINNLTVSELLDKYAIEESDNDVDYVPKEDENDEESSSSFTSTTSADDSEKDTSEKSSETQNETIKSKNEPKSEAPKQEDIKENGQTNHQPVAKPPMEHKFDLNNTTDSDNEQMHTPKGIPEANGLSEPGKINEKPAVTTEVAPRCSMNTPKTTLNHLSAPHIKENEKKATPGHESAASLKYTSPPVDNGVPLINPKERKSYRTITTQTAIELDWTITIKTEITHKKHYPKLEKINCSVDLTPASSTEDIFYSPTGSHQDFYSIFHPAPIINGANGEAQTSTPVQTDHYVRSSMEMPETMMATGNQKRNINHSVHYKHNHHFNAKNRTKNRR